GGPVWFGYMGLEFVGSIGMFIPLGFLLGLALPGWGLWLALLILPAYSGAIEWTQGEFLGDRVSDIRDVVSNSIGAWIGTIMAAFIRAMVHARDRKVLARARWEAEHRGGGARSAQRGYRDPNATAVIDNYSHGADRTPTAPTRILPY